MVFLVLTLLVTMIMALLQVATSNAMITDHTRNNQQVLMMAQSGINQAINELNLGKSVTGNHLPGNPNVSWGTEQSYAVTTVANADGTKTITSIGTFANNQSAGNVSTVQRKMIAIVTGTPGSGKFAAGGFGKTALTFSGSSGTDSYDSSLGTSYAQQVAAAGGMAAYQSTIGAGGNVMSNGPITGSGSMAVRGNATPGPGQTVTLSGSAHVTGSTAPSAAALNYPSYVYSPPISSAGTFSTNGAVTISTGTYRYDKWSQSGVGTVTFTGSVVNLYIDGDFAESGSAALIVSSGTIVNVYQGASGQFALSGGGIANVDSIPSHFNIVSASTKQVALSGSSDMFATCYAPDAPVKVSGKGQFYGAVIGNSLDLSGQGTFHFDKAATSPAIQGGVTLVAIWEQDM